MTGIAIVGTGMWGPRLAGAAERAGLELVTCFGRDEGKRREFAERFGCEPAASLEEAIGHSRVEGVVLATPNDVHEEQTLACAERGRHVLVEKPIADSVEAAQRMREACAEPAGSDRSGAPSRCEPAGVSRQASWPGAPGPRRYRSVGRQMRHMRDFDGPHSGNPTPSPLPFGQGPDNAERNGRSATRRRASGRFAHLHTHAEIDDVGVVTLEFESGALGALTGSYVSPKTLSLRLLGTEAVLDYRTDFSVWPDARALDGVTTLTLDGEPVEFEERDMLAEELAEFGRCIRGEAEPETGADEGIAALAAVVQALETHAEAVG